MTERLNVLYLPHPAIPDTNDPERVRTLEDLLVDKHNFFIFDPDQPVAPQFAEIDFVIDIGGSVGTREMVDAAAHRCRMCKFMALVSITSTWIIGVPRIFLFAIVPGHLVLWRSPNVQ